jgi:hypothetical protein
MPTIIFLDRVDATHRRPLKVTGKKSMLLRKALSPNSSPPPSPIRTRMGAYQPPVLTTKIAHELPCFPI